MKKVVLNVIFVIYAIVAVFVTICLLSYNQFRVTEFGDCSLVIIDSDDLNPDYQKGDLVIVEKADIIRNGEKAFFYNTYQSEIQIKLGTVTDSEKVTSTETTYTVEDDHKISSEYVLGTTKTATKIPVAGTVLGVLESKWGFLFLIVLPALLLFFYQISVVISEIKENKADKGKDKDEEE